MNPSLADLLGVAAPAGGAIVAAGTFLLSPLHGRDLVDDVLRGAGIGGVLGTTLALAIWSFDQLGVA